ncbi:MAG: TolC family protein [Elusimicrobia bacterium]|nr:TolC family protein [Elusimicrobiota bacterium]
MKFRRGVAVGLAACQLLCLPGVELYATLGQTIASGGENRTTPAGSFSFFLNSQGISSERDYPALPPEEKARLESDFRSFETETIQQLQRLNLLEDDFWVSLLTAQSGRLSNFGVWLGMQFRRRGIPPNIAAFQSAKQHLRSNPQLLRQPLSVRDALARVFEQSSADAETAAADTSLRPQAKRPVRLPADPAPEAQPNPVSFSRTPDPAHGPSEQIGADSQQRAPPAAQPRPSANPSLGESIWRGIQEFFAGLGGQVGRMSVNTAMAAAGADQHAGEPQEHPQPPLYASLSFPAAQAATIATDAVSGGAPIAVQAAAGEGSSPRAPPAKRRESKGPDQNRASAQENEEPPAGADEEVATSDTPRSPDARSRRSSGPRRARPNRAHPRGEQSSAQLARRFDGVLRENYAIATYTRGRNKGQVAQTFASGTDLSRVGNVRYYKRDELGWVEIADPAEVHQLEAAGADIEAYIGHRDDPEALRVLRGARAAQEDWEAFSRRAARRLEQNEFYRLLGDDAALARATKSDADARRLASEVAAYQTLRASLEADPNGGDPVLRDQVRVLEETEREVQAAIAAYQSAMSNEATLFEIYQQAKEIARTERSMQNIMRANTELVQVLLLKRGYMFLDLATRRLRDMLEEVQREKERNRQDIGALANKREDVQRKLRIAEEMYQKALRGDFVREVEQRIQEIQDKLNEADALLSSIGNIENLLNGGWGNLAGTFLDPAVVDKEIADWTDLRDNDIKPLYDKVRKFLDILRAISEREADEFGDTHFTSVHLWTEELIASLQTSEGAIRTSMDEFRQLKGIRDCIDNAPNPQARGACFYIGVREDPELQATPDQVASLLTRREGFALLTFGYAVIDFKIAESTLNALRLAYRKDAGFPDNIGPEPYYDNTLSRMDAGRAVAAGLKGLAIEGLEMERDLLVNRLGVISNTQMDELVNMIREDFQAVSPEGYAHRAYAALKRAMGVAETSLEFYHWKRSFLASGPSFFQFLEADVIGKQSEISHLQLDMANALLDFLRTYERPAAAAKADTYLGFIKLYRDGFGTLHQAEESFFNTEAEGLQAFEEFINELSGTFLEDFNNIKRWLENINPREDPAMRRLARAISDAGEEIERRLKNKKFLIYAAEETKKQRQKLRETLERLRVERERVAAMLERVNPDDPSFARGREMVLQGELLYPSDGFDDPDQINNRSGALFVRRNTVNRILSQGALAGGQTPSVNSWVSALGLSNYEVIPVGSGADSFYVVVNFTAGTALGSGDQVVNNFTSDTLLKFGNLGEVLGHNMSLSLYDWKDLAEPPRGARGIRATFERDRADERYINTTVIDIHQNLQQGHIYRLMVFENMAFMVLQDRLFISLTGFGDFPLNQGATCEPGADGNAPPGCNPDAPPYVVGGRAKATLYLHEVVGINASVLGLFARDPYEFSRTINTSIDPLNMNEESVHIEGAILQYIQRHAGVEFDLAKIFSTKNTFSVEFFIEDENGTEVNNGEVSDEYRENVADNYHKFWKGARIVKEIHFNMFGEPTSIRGETRAALDQNNELELAGRVALILPRGISIEVRGARYGEQYTGQVALNLRLGAGSELYLSYGTDRIRSVPRLMLGVRTGLTLEQLRRNASANAEEALRGGDTLGDFREELDRVLPRSTSTATGDSYSMNLALRRILDRDTRIAALTQAIGAREAEAVELQRVFNAGLSANAGVVLGTGYSDPQSEGTSGGSVSQKAYGFSSTAGGIQVGAEIFMGLTRPQKEAAMREIARMKVMLLDLKAAYNESIEGFRTAGMRVVLARLRVRQLEGIKSRPDVAGDPTLLSAIELEELEARSEQAQAEALLRARLGLALRDPLPREIESIPIDPNNPEATLAAVTRAFEFRNGWRQFLQRLSETDPGDTARPGWAERAISFVSPLNFLPFIDELTISLGANLWDEMGNSFAGIGGSVKLTLWDADRRHRREATVLEGQIADLDVAERLMRENLQNNPDVMRFDRWALEREKEIMDVYIAGLRERLDAAQTLTERLRLLDDLAEAARESSRIYLELARLPRLAAPATPPRRERYRVNEFAPLIQQAESRSRTLAKLALETQVAQHLEEAAQARFNLGVRLGARWNPVNNIWFETNTAIFTTGGWGMLLPSIELAIKSSGTSRVEERFAHALARATVADRDLQSLDLRRQIVEAYLRLVFSESAKRELIRRAEESQDLSDIARFNIEILELRMAVQKESLRLLILLGLDPNTHELDLEELMRRNPVSTAEALRPWIESNLSRAPEIQRRALEARLEVVRAMEGKLLLRERGMNIRTDPIGALFQVVGDIVAGLFGEEGPTGSSQVDLIAVRRHRLELERTLERYDRQMVIDRNRATVRLGSAERAIAEDPSMMNRLNRELAWSASIAKGFSGTITSRHTPLITERRSEPLLRWGARVYVTEEADPTPGTAGRSKRFFDPNTRHQVTYYEGMIQIMLSRPQMINPRLLARAEELEREREVRTERMESDMRQSRLSGLVWRHQYLTDRLNEAVDQALRERIAGRIRETENQIQSEFALVPEEYPSVIRAHPINTDDLNVLVNTALRYVVGDAPVLGSLQSDLAIGRLQGQAIVDNLRYQSMSPSFVLGYLRNGIIGGMMVSAPTAGRTPGADLFRDIDFVIHSNIASVLAAGTLAGDARERLAQNYFALRYLVDELAQREVFLYNLKTEMERDPSNIDLLDHYHNAFEETLLATSKMHELYLQIEADLKLLGIQIPRGLGRGSRDPWTMDRRVRAMGNAEALSLAREINPTPVARWHELTPDEKQARLEAWGTQINARLTALPEDERSNVENMAQRIRRDASLRFRRDNRPAGVLTALEADGNAAYGATLVVSALELEEWRTQRRLTAYDSGTGQRISLSDELLEDPSRRIFLAPFNYRGQAPSTIQEAAAAGFMEFHPGREETARSFNLVTRRFEENEGRWLREQAYHSNPDSFAVMNPHRGAPETPSSESEQEPIRVLLESEAFELASRRQLVLWRRSTQRALDPTYIANRTFWQRQAMEIYLNGDYYFTGQGGARVWTFEELLRDGRLLVFEENPIEGVPMRISPEEMNAPNAPNRSLRFFAYFGRTPEILAGIQTADELDQFGADVREITSTQNGDSRLRRDAHRELRRAMQSAYVYLKTSYGFLMNEQGRIEKVFMSDDDLDEAQDHHPKNRLFKSNDMTVVLDADGNIVEALMTALDGSQWRQRFGGAGPATTRWHRNWGAIEIDRDFRVRRIVNKDTTQDGPLSSWAYFMDDNRIYPVARNRFPGGADAGLARAVAVVNPDAGTTVVYSADMLKEFRGEVRGNLTRTQIRPWLLTLGFAGEVVTQAFFTPWLLPLTIGVGGANTADRIHALTGEGAMEQSWGFALDLAWDIANQAIFRKVVPQPQDHLNDPSGYPQLVARDPASTWDRALYYISLTLAGRNSDRLVEVDPRTDQSTNRVVRPGAKALERSLRYREEDYEVLRGRVLAAFTGGIELRERRLVPGAYGHWRDTQLQVLPQGETYTQVVNSLRSIGVRFAPDGSFLLEVMPTGSEVSGQLIPGIPGAEARVQTAETRGRDHDSWERIISGPGGTAHVRFENGRVDSRRLLAGAEALENWRRRVRQTLDAATQTIYDAPTNSYLSRDGTWLFNPQTMALVLFDSNGRVREIHQAFLGYNVARENFENERRRYEFQRSYPELLTQGGVVHLNARGDVTSFELGDESVRSYLAERLNGRSREDVLAVVRQDYTFSRPDGGQDVIVFSADSIAAYEAALRARAERYGVIRSAASPAAP